MIEVVRFSLPRPRCAASHCQHGVHRCVHAPFHGESEVLHVGSYFHKDFRLDWLTSQARDVRGPFSHRALRTSGDVPCHLSAKPHV